MSGLWLRASGMVTALGYNAPASLAALRAGVSGVRTRLWADEEGGEPYACAQVSLPQRWAGVALLADLLSPAVLECLQAMEGVSLTDIPLLVGVSEPDRPGRPGRLEQELLGAVADRLEARLHPDSAVFPFGQAGAAQAIALGQALIQAGRADHILVAGVDSYLDRDTLSRYDQQRRLLCTGNSNGFLPGEAASAVLLSRSAGDDARTLRIVGLGQSMEHATIDSTEPLLGQGLTQAVRTALAAAGMSLSEIAFRLTDLSGEHYKFKEAMFIPMRLDRGERSTPLALWHPIEYLGEIGAAILPCLLSWADHAVRWGYAPGPRALCHVGSDHGHRAALVLQHG
jgi:3-oxoacyl-[acyl-carrier-protein] synthase I